MAESKGSLLARSMQKHAGRAKEKLLQNLGKVDRTSDGIFEEYLANFNRQQSNANRLQKEFNNYIRCIRAVQNASKSLMDAVAEVYENQWTGCEALQAQMSAVEVLWQDFSHKLGDQVLIPLNTYTAQFPEMKKKIEKRNRKLLDYDNQRHSFESLQANAAKKKDDVKVTKGREQLEEARRTFEIMNSELHDELPALHDSRILFLVTNLQTLFASEQVFHHETDKIYGELEAIVDKLATESQRGSYTMKKSNAVNNNNSSSSNQAQSPLKTMANSTVSINNTSSSYPQQPITNGNSHSQQNVDEPLPSKMEGTGAAGAAAAEPHQEPVQTTTMPVVESSIQPDPVASSTKESRDNRTNDEHNDTSLSTVSASVSTAASNPSSPVKERMHIPTDNSSANNNNINTNSSTSNNAHEMSPSSEPSYQNTAAAMNTGTTTTVNNSSSSTPAVTKDEMNSIQSEAIAQQHQQDHGRVIKDDLTSVDGGAKTVTTNGHANSISNNNISNIDEIRPTPSANGGGAVAEEKGKGVSKMDLPAGVLYRVQATYRYIKEDPDELSFEVGDTIRVIEYDDPEDQEEGWLMGQLENSGVKGLFPANFTRPL